MSEEIVSFMRNGDMCREFGCTMERLNYQGGTDSYMNLKCKYCKKEVYTSWV